MLTFPQGDDKIERWEALAIFKIFFQLWHICILGWCRVRNLDEKWGIIIIWLEVGDMVYLLPPRFLLEMGLDTFFESPDVRTRIREQLSVLITQDLSEH